MADEPIKKLASNPTVLFGAAGVMLALVSLYAATKAGSGSSSFKSSGGPSGGGSGGINSSDLTSQVNTVNANAAAVSQKLIGANAGVESQTIAALQSVANQGLGATSETGKAAIAAQSKTTQDLLDRGTQYAMYDAGARAGVITNAHSIGAQELATVESGITSRFATSTNATAHEYDSQLNALTTMYGDHAAVAISEIASYPSEFGSVGTSTANEIGSEARQGAAESQAQASAASSAWSAIASLGKSAASAFTGGFGGFGGGSSSSSAGVAAPNAGSFGTWGGDGSSNDAAGGASSSAGPGGFLTGDFGASDPASGPGWKFNPAPTPPNTLSGNPAKRYLA